MKYYLMNYDNNISLLPYAMSHDFDVINNYLLEHGPRLGKDWVSAARELLTSELRKILINLQGYEIKFDGDEKFTKKRVLVMNQLINQQIKNILGKGKAVGFSDINGWNSKSKSISAKDRAKALLNEGL